MTLSRTRVIAGGVGAALGVLLSFSVADATPPGRNGVIAYAHRPAGCPDSGPANLFTVRPDGSRRRKLTSYSCRSATSGSWPSWSPSGARLLYLRTRDRSSDTVITRPNGDGKRVFSEELALGWSPAGQQLVWRIEGDRDGLYVGPADDPAERYLASGSGPTWAPDGTQVALTEPAPGCPSEERQLSIYDAATATRVRTVVAPTRVGSSCADTSVRPNWSPDGRWIAFSNTGSLDAGGYDIYVIDVNGNRRRRLTRSPGQDTAPVWSPDGRWIAYLRPSGHYQDLYVMRPDGSRKHRIARRVMEPAWQRLPKR